MTEAHQTEDLGIELSNFAREWLNDLRRESGGYSAEVFRHINAQAQEIERLRDAVETVRRQTRMDMSISYMGFRYGVGSQFGIDSLRRAINENKHY
jgi:hypothetical protein